MDDVFLRGVVNGSVYFVTPLSNFLYRQAHGHGLGGAEGYFICSASESQPDAGFEILAKAASFEAAQQIFLALTRSSPAEVHG